MKKSTHIRIDVKLKKRLDGLKRYPHDTYEDVINRLLEPTYKRVEIFTPRRNK